MTNIPLNLLGGLTPATFLRDYWQKKPLLVRGAIPGFKGVIDKKGLFELASRDDVESRLVTQEKKAWSLAHGPFRPSAFRKRTAPWSLLVQGVNLFDRAAADLLQRFSFMPYARLDDLMVSYASADGGVGPHFDSYDVFLLQGPGRRRWRISDQKDRTLTPGMPLKILKKFRPRQEWVLEPGDMLYLPPNYAHDGVALGDDCFTYSIGFRAPSVQEIATGFLIHLQDEARFDGRYADPDLTPQPPGEISAQMLDRICEILEKIKWTRDDVACFLGRYLSEPKASVFFDPPATTLSAAKFRQRAARDGFALALKTQLLYRGSNFFMNGEIFSPPDPIRTLLRALADQRALAPQKNFPASFLVLAHEWYTQGYLEFGQPQ